ncbi:MAG TPA: hypothetical protein VG323_14000 [Thermoanaerobaculia bacterium]|nr:hypothetical protein [Thermoanaerobaculia bacterium]
MRTLLTALALAALAACAKPTTAPAAGAQKLKGTVLETKRSGGVTFVRLKSGADERWVVTAPTENLKTGAAVTVQLFDNVAFGQIEEAPVNVDKASGADAKTVAEVWASKGQLKDRQVVVRAKVVKFLPSIMGKNWMHVRDGSGSHAKGDDDLAVITDDPAKVGSVVTLTGTVRVDKDFGAGYQYPVIIEGAKLK